MFPKHKMSPSRALFALGALLGCEFEFRCDHKHDYGGVVTPAMARRVSFEMVPDDSASAIESEDGAINTKGNGLKKHALADQTPRRPLSISVPTNQNPSVSSKHKTDENWQERECESGPLDRLQDSNLVPLHRSDDHDWSPGQDPSKSIEWNWERFLERVRANRKMNSDQIEGNSISCAPGAPEPIGTVKLLHSHYYMLTGYQYFPFGFAPVSGKARTAKEYYMPEHANSGGDRMNMNNHVEERWSEEESDSDKSDSDKSADNRVGNLLTAHPAKKLSTINNCERATGYGDPYHSGGELNIDSDIGVGESCYSKGSIHESLKASKMRLERLKRDQILEKFRKKMKRDHVKGKYDTITDSGSSTSFLEVKRRSSAENGHKSSGKDVNEASLEENLVKSVLMYQILSDSKQMDYLVEYLLGRGCDGDERGEDEGGVETGMEKDCNGDGTNMKQNKKSDNRGGNIRGRNAFKKNKGQFPLDSLDIEEEEKVPEELVDNHSTENHLLHLPRSSNFQFAAKSIKSESLGSGINTVSSKECEPEHSSKCSSYNGSGSIDDRSVVIDEQHLRSENRIANNFDPGESKLLLLSPVQGESESFSVSSGEAKRMGCTKIQAYLIGNKLDNPMAEMVDDVINKEDLKRGGVCEVGDKNIGNTKSESTGGEVMFETPLKTSVKTEKPLRETETQVMMTSMTIQKPLEDDVRETMKATLTQHRDASKVINPGMRDSAAAASRTDSRRTQRKIKTFRFDTERSKNSKILNESDISSISKPIYGHHSFPQRISSSGGSEISSQKNSEKKKNEIINSDKHSDKQDGSDTLSGQWWSTCYGNGAEESKQISKSQTNSESSLYCNSAKRGTSQNNREKHCGSDDKSSDNKSSDNAKKSNSQNINCKSGNYKILRVTPKASRKKEEKDSSIGTSIPKSISETQPFPDGSETQPFPELLLTFLTNTLGKSKGRSKASTLLPWSQYYAKEMAKVYAQKGIDVRASVLLERARESGRFRRVKDSEGDSWMEACDERRRGRGRGSASEYNLPGGNERIQTNVHDDLETILSEPMDSNTIKSTEDNQTKPPVHCDDGNQHLLQSYEEQRNKMLKEAGGIRGLATKCVMNYTQQVDRLIEEVEKDMEKHTEFDYLQHSQALLHLKEKTERNREVLERWAGRGEKLGWLTGEKVGRLPSALGNQVDDNENVLAAVESMVSHALDQHLARVSKTSNGAQTHKPESPEPIKCGNFKPVNENARKQLQLMMEHQPDPQMQSATNSGASYNIHCEENVEIVIERDYSDDGREPSSDNDRNYKLSQLKSMFAESLSASLHPRTMSQKNCDPIQFLHGKNGNTDVNAPQNLKKSSLKTDSDDEEVAQSSKKSESSSVGPAHHFLHKTALADAILSKSDYIEYLLENASEWMNGGRNGSLKNRGGADGNLGSLKKGTRENPMNVKSLRNHCGPVYDKERDFDGKLGANDLNKGGGKESEEKPEEKPDGKESDVFKISDEFEQLEIDNPSWTESELQSQVQSHIVETERELHDEIINGIRSQALETLEGLTRMVLEKREDNLEKKRGWWMKTGLRSLGSLYCLGKWKFSNKQLQLITHRAYYIR